jgi:hypothetical protein
LAAFLGDPNFPQITMSATQGEKIIRFQNLYKMYSGLAFSNPCDRPVAVDGIQNRLLRAFGTRGGFGIFDEDVKSGQRGLLRRSLLWHRAPNAELTRINFSPSRALEVPSWSWMAYMGEIDYLKLDFGKVEWEYLRSPWSGGVGDSLLTTSRGGNIALTGEAQDITFDAAVQHTGKVYFDSPGGSERSPLKCVVMGIEQGSQVRDSRIHYFILVGPAQSRKHDGTRVYERIGAGYLPGRCISPEGSPIKIY